MNSRSPPLYKHSCLGETVFSWFVETSCPLASHMLRIADVNLNLSHCVRSHTVQKTQWQHSVSAARGAALRDFYGRLRPWHSFWCEECQFTHIIWSLKGETQSVGQWVVCSLAWHASKKFNICESGIRKLGVWIISLVRAHFIGFFTVVRGMKTLKVIRWVQNPH